MKKRFLLILFAAMAAVGVSANAHNARLSNPSASTASPTGNGLVYADGNQNIGNIPLTTITYAIPSRGTYMATYSERAIEMTSTGDPIEKQSSETVQLSATAEPGYKFLRWVKVVDGVKSYFASTPSISVSFAEDAQVYAEFVSANLATFKVDGTSYGDLHEAINNAAGKSIIVASSGILPAGDYTIATNMKLVVPYEETGTKGIETPNVVTTASKLESFLTLTFARGANLTVNGVLAVAGNICSATGGKPSGYTTGKCGVIDMSQGGHIDVCGTLYCWGFIKGPEYDGTVKEYDINSVGSITAKSGAMVKECYAIGDWGGGSYTYAVGKNDTKYRIYPFQSYFIQNIEVPTHYECGAKNYLYTNITATALATKPKQYDIDNIPFISNETKALFKIEEGGVATKWYNAFVDSLVIKVEGTAQLNNMNIKISAGFTTIDVKSQDFHLPILSNMYIKLVDGHLTLNAPMKMQAGAIMEVSKGSSLTLSSDLYMYDSEDWGKFVQGQYFKCVPSILTRYNKNRGDGTINTLNDAQIIADGDIIMKNGRGVFTTSHGANLMGNHGGTIQWQESLPKKATTYGYKGGTTISGKLFMSRLLSEHIVSAECDPAKAHNENDTYTAAWAGTTFTNVHGRWFGGKAKEPKSDHTYDFTYLGTGGNDVTTDAIYWEDATVSPSEWHWNNAIRLTEKDNPYYANTWEGTEGEDLKTVAYYCYTTYTQEGTPQDGWVRLTKPNESEDCFNGSDGNKYMYLADKWQVVGKSGDPCPCVLVAKVEPAEGGSVSGAGLHSCNEEQTLTAVPNVGYEFQKWSDESTENPHKVTGDVKEITAYFVKTTTEKGTPLDIVDWTENKLTINTTGFVPQWPYTINGTEFQLKNGGLNSDRTATIPYTGNSDEEVWIAAVNKSGVVMSQHKYRIPHIYSGNTTLSTETDALNGNSVIFVKNNAVLTIASSVSVSAIYVAPGAELVVSEGATLTVDSLMLRTTPWEAAILENQGTISANKVYYTRIVSDRAYHQFALPLASKIADVRLSNGATFPYAKTWLLKRYDESSRAKNGAGVSSNWVEVAKDETIKATKGYELYSGSAYYREIYFPVTLPEPTPSLKEVLVSYTKKEGDAGPAHRGWNALCSPLLGRSTPLVASTNQPSDQLFKVSILTEAGNYYQDALSVINPAVPFYYQASEAETTLRFSSVSSSTVKAAPQRTWDTSVSEQWLRLTIHNAAGTMLDVTNIFVHPEKFSTDYEPGYDVAKQSLTASTAVLYSSWPCGPLAFAAIPDSVAADRIPLTVSAGKAGEYTFSLQDNNYLERLDHVFLYDAQTGAVTDLLGDDYTIALPQGTAAGRFYIRCVFAPVSDITTDIVPAGTEDMQTNHVQKFLYNDRVYILRNGVFYDLTGRPCELQ